MYHISLKQTQVVLLLPLTICLLTSFYAMSVDQAYAQAKAPKRVKQTFKLDGVLSTSLYLRNDTDFDPSPRFDDLDGQRDGQIATYFNPRLSIDTGHHVKVYYQLELGWNAWGLNNPSQDQQFMSMPGQALQGRHRLAYASWQDHQWSLDFGFQDVRDPSGLFLNHAIGAIKVKRVFGKSSLKLIFAQMPDTTYEGVGFNRDYITDDNLSTDRFVWGGHYRLKAQQWRVHVAGYLLTDDSQFERSLRLGTFVFGTRYKTKKQHYWLHLLGQSGSQDQGGALNQDVEHQAFAIQGGAQVTQGRFTYSVRSFALSADDDLNGNSLQSAFFGSAKNRSKTRLFTEDESRDRYDNLDERMGSYLGVLAYNPAGLMVSDLSLMYRANDWYRLDAVVGLASTLNPNRALGARYMGTELSLYQGFTLSPAAQFFVTALALLPGKAAAVLINDQDRSAQQTLYGVNLGLNAQF
ncbi:MAG: hypothetical protein CMH49_01845 [Myxococcales bacterium]|nr:hypothetical protein [Myxococcales bacterium]